jgi:hypothetical protein
MPPFSPAHRCGRIRESRLPTPALALGYRTLRHLNGRRWQDNWVRRDVTYLARGRVVLVAFIPFTPAPERGLDTQGYIQPMRLVLC